MTLILVIGIALLTAAVIADRRNALRTARQTRPPLILPDASDAPLDTPTYITSAQLLAQAPPAVRFSPDQERELGAQLADKSTAKIACRLASQALATHTGIRAILDQPAVLVCSDMISEFRELMSLLAAASADKMSLVVAASCIDAEVLQTLAANRLAGTVDVAVVLGDDMALAELAEASGSPVASLQERQAGAVRLRNLGRPSRIVASEDATWVVREAQP